MSYKNLITSVVVCIMFACNVFCVKVFVPLNFDPAVSTEDFLGAFADINLSNLYTFSRMYINPQGADTISLAPYYYRTKVKWINADGTAFLVNGAPFFSEAYLAVIYDNNVRRWCDVSGIGIDVNGIDRLWPHQSAYFSCSASYGGTRFLQAFREGSVGSSLLYDQVSIGAGTLPPLKVISAIDSVLLQNPVLGAQWQLLLDEVQIMVVVAKDALLQSHTAVSTATYQNSFDSTKKPSFETVSVTFPCGGALVTYAVSLNDLYQVVTQLPTQRTKVVQSFIIAPSAPLYPLNGVVPVPQGVQVPGASVNINISLQQSSSSVVMPFPFLQNKQFVASQLGLVLADYYVKMGSLFIAVQQARDVSGQVIPNAFIAWRGTVDPKNLQLPSGVGSVQTSINISADSTQVSIVGYPYLADTAHADSNCYFGNPLVSLDGVPTGFVIAAHERFFQGRAATSQQYFQGQVSFYLSSLRMLQAISKEELVASPYYVYPLALQFSTQRHIAKLGPDDNFIPVQFTTSDKQTWNGMLVLKTDFFPKGADTTSYKSPQEYYIKVPINEKYQLWYTVDNKTPLQVPSGCMGTTITAMNMMSLEAYAAWPEGLSDAFKAAAISFVGQKMKTKTPGFLDRIAAIFKPSVASYEKVPEKS